MTDPAIRNAYRQHALEMWGVLDKNAKTGIRYGMFPANAMREAERLGYDDGKLLCLELMAIAEQNGGMRA